MRRRDRRTFMDGYRAGTLDALIMLAGEATDRGPLTHEQLRERVRLLDPVRYAELTRPLDGQSEDDVR